MQFRKITHATPGQALILVALLSVVLVAMVGLAIDGGNYFMQRRNALNVADAAALASTRAFLQAKREQASNSAANAAAYTAAATFISQHLNTAQTTFKVSYYLNNGDPSNRYYTLTGPTDGSSLPSAKSGQELVVRGVEVEIDYSFNTFFMQIFHYDTSSVNAKGLGYFGYLGSAVGQDVVPLALDMSAGNQLRDGGRFRIHMFNDSNPAYLLDSYDIYSSQVGMLTFVNDEAAEAASGCNGSANSYRYTWCAGSSTAVQIGDAYAVQAGTFNNSIRHYIQSRIDSGKDVVLIPEYFGDPKTGSVTINSFIAVKLVDIEHNALIVEYTPYVYTSGSISGNGNGIPGAYAINLVQ